MANFDNFFDDSKPSIKMQEQTKLTEFKPNPKRGQNGVFKAIVRFIPNPENKEEKSVIMKYTAYLKNPRTQVSRTIDCPCTVSQPDPIQERFFALRKSSNTILQENAKMFSHKQSFASIVQVISCESDPSLVNKFLVWRFGIKVYEKINTEMYPPIGESRDPFNILTGRPFLVQVKEVMSYPNYDSCMFVDLNPTQGGIRMVGTDAAGQPSVSVITEQTLSTPQGKEMVFNYICDNIPDMTKYEYHPWDAETTEFVNECIRIYSDPNETMQAAAAAQNPGATTIQSQPTYSQAAAQPIAMPTMPTPTAGDPNIGISAAMPTMNPTPNMNANISGINAMTPGGFQADAMNADVNDLLNNNNESKKQEPAPMMDITDLLNGTIIGG